MEFISSDIGREYDRWVNKIAGNDNYGGPKTLSVQDVLAAHFLIAF